MQIHMVYKNDSILDPLRHMQPHRSQGRASGFGGGSNKIKKIFLFFFCNHTRIFGALTGPKILA